MTYVTWMLLFGTGMHISVTWVSLQLGVAGAFLGIFWPISSIFRVPTSSHFFFNFSLFQIYTFKWLGFLKLSTTKPAAVFRLFFLPVLQ